MNDDIEKVSARLSSYNFNFLGWKRNWSKMAKRKISEKSHETLAWVCEEFPYTCASIWKWLECCHEVYSLLKKFLHVMWIFITCVLWLFKIWKKGKQFFNLGDYFVYVKTILHLRFFNRKLSLTMAHMIVLVRWDLTTYWINK